MRRSGLPKTAISEKARRILFLVSEKNADSDTSDGVSSGDEAGMIGSVKSSPVPSINSSLERLNLRLSDDEIGTHADDIYTDKTEVPLTATLTQVFSNPSESNYDALPSVSSLPSLPSDQPLASMPVGKLLTRAQKMKRKAPAIVAGKIKRQCSRRIKDYNNNSETLLLAVVLQKTVSILHITKMNLTFCAHRTCLASFAVLAPLMSGY